MSCGHDPILCLVIEERIVSAWYRWCLAWCLVTELGTYPA